MSIQVSGLYKHFGQFTALNNVSIEFPSGGLVALLGPSGCGKTSLLRVIAGLERPDSGTVAIQNRDVSGLDIRERQVGFVFQHYALFRHMTIFENVAFGLRAKPKARRPNEATIKQKVNRLLQLVQLDWLADRYPAQLSGGQRQRVALARALAIEPQVLLLDEPFGALDAKVRKELRRWLRKLHDELHITSLFVTHDQEEALEVADHIVVMNKGQIEQIGTPEEIYRTPRTEFVYQFVGSSNRLYLEDSNGLSFTPSDVVSTHGKQAKRIYCRPHDFAVNTQHRPDAIPVAVARKLALGNMVRLEAYSLDNQQLVEVELSNHDPVLDEIQAKRHLWLTPKTVSQFA
ncbi:TPA: sulfate ABC transporter ATP-binding protein [Vibrio vulnificus]|uniref:Sulfate and thiosulfate import ATP-binding protein CysA n=1 Tax=Vibrio vulnificus TaxID=672 RepID=A0AAN1PT60_VIBVL|nr:sulfate ABC transporter ATP-binding protein [Vibrio vulnificus]ANN29184.1 Sulfate and thiosulfate import ATP-binding protein CysA [Vibrio vulnificus]ARN68569.1 Sulfate and thiosulfate import ATP-binding protein CysA [Vibrio vulnificus]AXX62444.1 Sulfate and thiosulfate import ATP-binding protein CysA [Vibrio vulnificus]QBH29578.1 Sulfate and thiosulfate import ATP-binding protein CysA [Vibrio vulnificus]WIL75791.1 sulfate ABC transporter ATP-binding protein [Vibrio vulnificus]